MSPGRRDASRPSWTSVPVPRTWSRSMTYGSDEVSMCSAARSTACALATTVDKSTRSPTQPCRSARKSRGVREVTARGTNDSATVRCQASSDVVRARTREVKGSVAVTSTGETGIVAPLVATAPSWSIRTRRAARCPHAGGRRTVSACEDGRMRVLVAPDCFTGTLSAPRAAAAIARGWARAAPGDEIQQSPLADGGPGFVAVLHQALGGELGSVAVSGPLGDRVPATVLLVAGDGGPTAYVESAEAVGLELVPAQRRDPTRASSVGVGELVRAALDTGARRIVVGVGGTSSNDGGAGLLAGLGGWDDGALRRGGGALDEVTATDLGGLG